MKYTLLLMLLSLCSVTIFSASFDCSKAETFVEMSICNDPDLSRLDDDLSEAYKAAKAEVADPEMLKKEQILWLKEVRNKCTSVDCLKGVYKERVLELNLKERKGLGRITGSYAITYEDESGYGGKYLDIVSLGNGTIQFLCGWTTWFNGGGRPMKEWYEGKAVDVLDGGPQYTAAYTFVSDIVNYKHVTGRVDEDEELYIVVDLKKKRAGWSFGETPNEYLPKISSRKPETSYWKQ